MAHADKFPAYLANLITQVGAGQLKIFNDFGECSEGGRFTGLNGAIRGVEVIEIISVRLTQFVSFSTSTLEKVSEKSPSNYSELNIT